MEHRAAHLAEHQRDSKRRRLGVERIVGGVVRTAPDKLVGPHEAGDEALAHGAAKLDGRGLGILLREQRYRLQPFAVGAAVVVKPIVIGAADRRRKVAVDVIGPDRIHAKRGQE